MIATVPEIPLVNLALAFLPVLVVVVVHRWSIGIGGTLYATGRMLVQLLLVGYVLAAIFQTESPFVVLAVLSMMLAAASWIALRPMKEKSLPLYGKSLLAIAIGGGVTLALMTQGVLRLEPWFLAQKVITLGGMSFTAAMNSVSLAGERFESEIAGGASYAIARKRAMLASLITITNSLLAVGVVSIPGFMTGQIIAGIEPIIAARYQIMIMCLVFGAGGIAAALFLVQLKPQGSDEA